MDRYVKIYKAVLAKATVFEGRAGKEEFWTFTLMNFVGLFLICFPIGVLSMIIPKLGLVMYGVLSLVILAVGLASVAVGIRRLHDTGKSGWFYCLNFAWCCGGGLVYLYLCFLDGQPGDNQFGPPPQDPAAQDYPME